LILEIYRAADDSMWKKWLGNGNIPLIFVAVCLVGRAVESEVDAVRKQPGC